MTNVGVNSLVAFAPSTFVSGMPETTPVPHVTPWLRKWFTSYSRRQLRRHFHSLRISCLGQPPPLTFAPVVVFTNHASWWDPLVCLALKDRFFPGRQAFAPIEAAALRKYRFFARLGFFGVEQGTARGAKQFLRTATAVLSSQRHMLWLTPQGRFADARERPVRFQAGLSRLPQRVERAWFLPLAIEYIFWEERLPEVLVRFGEPIAAGRAASHRVQPAVWQTRFEQALHATQNALATDVLSRDSDRFELLLSGRSGVGGVYDQWRSFLALIRREAFDPSHGHR